MNKLYKQKRISGNSYNSGIKDAKFWRNLGYIAAAITVICSVLSIPATILMKSTAVAVINALGFAKGMVISRALLVNDLISAYNHKPKYSKIKYAR